ncbi:MAG: M3 family peptidase, partial [Gammaproteobacteria bacterium]|nr:M3 family peptidase [Gammaproteobacteria bacterium]
MKNFIRLNILLSLLFLFACGKSGTDNSPAAEPQQAAAASSVLANAALPEKPDNVLLAEWTGPYSGVPAFDDMELDALKPALDYGMAAQLAEIDAIASNPAAPDFDNTIVALELAGDDLSQVFTYWGIWSSNRSSPEFRAIQQEMAPVLSEFFSKITQNEALYQRVKAVYDSRDNGKLDPVQVRLAELTYDGFVRNGATLKGDKKSRYTEIQKRLSELYTQFSNNVLADEENYVLYIDDTQLGGLPASFVKAAAAAATERGHEGKFAITNTRSSMSPF